MAALAQPGMGMLRTRPCLPRRSTITQRPFPLPDVLEAQPRAAQSAADHDGQHGAVAPALQGGRIRAVDERFGLALGEPVSGGGALREAVNDSFWASSANRTETNFPFDGKVSFFFAKNIIAHFCLVRKRLNWVEVESIERFRSTCECRSSLLRFAS